MRTSSLPSIIFFGKEAATNRWQKLGMVWFLLIFLPQFASVFLDGTTAEKFASQLRSGRLDNGAILDQIGTLYHDVLQSSVAFHILASLCSVLGVLCLAQLSWDYFEDRPPEIKGAIGRSLRLILMKGIGVLVMLFVVATASAMFSLMRVVITCLLVMLPVELVAGRRGGMRTVLDTLFLKYAHPTPLGRWPIFSNVMTIGGIALTVIFLTQIGLSELLSLDVLLDLNAHLWVQEVHIGNFAVNAMHLVSSLIDIFVTTVVLAIIIPFTAALRYVYQRPYMEVQA